MAWNLKPMSAMLDEFIARRRPDIVSEMGRRLGEQEPDRSRQELLHNVPEFLDEVRRALLGKASEVEGRAGLTGIAEEQGEQRQRGGMSPEVVARSFGLVCEVVSMLASQEGLMLPAREVQIMNESIDQGIASALTAYWDRSSEAIARSASRRLGVLAHELRNALATATHAFEAIHGGVVGTTGRTADMLDRSLKTMETLITHALFEAELKEKPPTIERLILREALEALDLTAGSRRSIAVVIDVPETLVVDVDRQLFGSAVTNLVHNGIKFTHEGGRVFVRGRVSDDAAVVEVADECGGLNMDPEALFAPFVQHHNDRSGVGLGLTIARESIERLGGTLTARNDPGTGCVFTIRLPHRHR